MHKLIAWFIHNPIAANLLMVLIAVGGITAIPTMDKEFFPQPKVDRININVSYPGAGPAEVEQQISMRIEEALDDVDGIKRMTSNSRESFGSVQVEIDSSFDTLSVLNEVKSRVDSINTFPTGSERPQVNQQIWNSFVIAIALSGDVGEGSLKELALKIKDELTALNDVKIVKINGLRDYELSVEISKENLQRFGVSFADVANAIRAQSINLPAGKLSGVDGDVLIQTRSQAYTGDDFADIDVIKRADGTRVTLGEIATIKDGFAESNQVTRFNGLPSVALNVFMSNNPDIMATSKAVHSYVADLKQRLPDGVFVETWQDMNNSYEDRVDTLLNSGFTGLVLVFVTLLLFLRPLLALWVSVGIAVAFLGSLWLLPLTGVSLSIISMFAYILILGIVVDDAIIVGESVYGVQNQGRPGVDGAIRGTVLVTKPVFFAVLTTMVVFANFYFLPVEHAEARHIAAAVLLALVFSLIECLFILPSHLAHMRPEKPSELPGLKQLDALRAYLASGLQSIVVNHYRPMLIACLEWRWLTLATFTIVLFISAAIYSGGWILRSFEPIVQSDFLVVRVDTYEGTAMPQLRKIMQQVENGAQELSKELNSTPVKYAGHIESAIYGERIFVNLALTNFENMPYSNAELVKKWRAHIGVLHGIKEFAIRSEIVDGGKDIQFEVSAATFEELQQSTIAVTKALSGYADLINVRSSLDSSRPEIVFELKPEAQNLNLSQVQLSQQIRRAFYGEEVQRIPRAREDVKVMVRYPREQREALDSMLNMKIRTADGKELPFETVADYSYQPSYTKIERVDRRRSAFITADLRSGAQAFQILQQLREKEFAKLEQQYSSTQILLKGEQEEAQEFEGAVQALMIATMIIIYAIMAVVFHSYWQPFLIVTAIPFGFVGALVGHAIIGREMSMFSLLGILAVAGVVVNDNLVLIDRINRYREEGLKLWDAIVEGSTDRFRAIILTSLTTFVGLLPILTERSVNAQFLIPMVASLAFGVLFATFVTLIFTPALYLAGESFHKTVENLKARIWPPSVNQAN